VPAMLVDYAFIAESADVQAGLFYVLRGGTDIWYAPPGSPFPVRRAVPTELHLRQVSPFALRYTIRSLDHVRLRPYFGAGLDMVVVIAEERGGRSPEARSDYEFGPLGSSDRLLRQAAEIERAAQEAYTALVSQIRPRDYMLSAAFMLVDEVRHLTVWRPVLGLQIY